VALTLGVFHDSGTRVSRSAGFSVLEINMDVLIENSLTFVHDMTDRLSYCV